MRTDGMQRTGMPGNSGCSVVGYLAFSSVALLTHTYTAQNTRNGREREGKESKRNKGNPVVSVSRILV